jgi:hypothetical protein
MVSSRERGSLRESEDLVERKDLRIPLAELAELASGSSEERTEPGVH